MCVLFIVTLQPRISDWTKAAVSGDRPGGGARGTGLGPVRWGSQRCRSFSCHWPLQRMFLLFGQICLFIIISFRHYFLSDRAIKTGLYFRVNFFFYLNSLNSSYQDFVDKSKKKKFPFSFVFIRYCFFIILKSFSTNHLNFVLMLIHKIK